MNSVMITALCMLVAVALDALLGEVRRAHPLVGFGNLATGIERKLWRKRRGAGVLAWLLTVLPWVALCWLATYSLAKYAPWALVAFNVLLLYFTIGLRSLGEHAKPIAMALQRADLTTARHAVSMIVGRDTHVLDTHGVALAATESVLENGNDAVFGALFWFAVAGAPGALLFRLTNTLDAMWGHHSPRYAAFGWMAARSDDALNFIPARLVVFTYGLCGRLLPALRCWRTQGTRWISPNAGPVMAAGAGAIGVQLGGLAPYRGAWVERPLLGEGAPPDAQSIRRALALVRRGVALWLLIALVIASARWWHA